MKVKTTVTSRPKTQTNINAKTGSHQSKTGKGKKKPKKEDNTKLFIGLGVGGFFLLILIIVAIANTGKSSAPVNQVVEEDSKKDFNLPIDIRKQIYKEYISQEEKIEDDSRNKISASGTDSRQVGGDVRSEVDRQLSELKISLLTKWKTKYPDMTMKFIKAVISEGISKNWR